MSRLTTSFVLGYHGCDRQDGEAFLNGSLTFRLGSEPYHWLGAGVYFWEGDPLRALEWAHAKAARGACDDPFVVGAVIYLGNCLDLQVRENVDLIRDAYHSFLATREKAGLPIPVNKKARNDASASKVLRFLDCAVIDHLHAASEAADRAFDSVRGVFCEGDSAFPGSGILDRSHSQIAVRNLSCVKGVFRLAASNDPATPQARGLVKASV